MRACARAWAAESPNLPSLQRNDFVFFSQNFADFGSITVMTSLHRLSVIHVLDVFGIHLYSFKRISGRNHFESCSCASTGHVHYVYMHRCERFPPDSPVNAALLRINFAVVNCCSAHSIWLLNDEKAQDLCVKDSRCGKNCSY